MVTATTWSAEINGSVERTYDNYFRVASISVNGANPVSYTYDDDGLLIQAGGMTLTRDPDTGFLTGTTLGVVTTSYTYSPFGELSQMSAAVSGTPIYTTTYTRDKLGRITTKVEMIQGVTKTYDYGYDDAGRLDTVTIDGILEADYDYDLNGNRLSKTTPGGTETGTYDAQDRMLSYGGADYTYSSGGDLVAKAEGAGVTTFDYDALGNLTATSLPNGTDFEFVSDAKNRRIGTRINGLLTRTYLWQSLLALSAELDSSGAIVSRFAYATKVNAPDFIIQGDSTLRVLADHLGSPRLVVDCGSGEVVQRVDWNESGEELQNTSPGLHPFGFAGGLRDPSIELLRFGARDYDPHSGRWTARDPILFHGQSANLYGYLDQDPVNRRDPDGRQGPVVPVTKVLKPLLDPTLVAYCEALKQGDQEQHHLEDPYDDLACEEGESPRDVFPGDSARLLTLKDCEHLGYFAEDQVTSDRPEDRNALKHAIDNAMDGITWFLGKLFGGSEDE